MASCALVGAVDFNAQHFLAQQFDYVIAVDAGYRHLEALDVIPDLVIGDFDSLGLAPRHANIKTFPVRKDQSDIELALYEAEKLGYDELVIYGCIGGRIDFTYALYQLLVHFAEAGARVFAISEDQAVTTLVGGKQASLQFAKEACGLLSLFAVTHELCGVDEVGLEYTLDKAVLQNDTPMGVSNAFCGKPASVSVQEGTALLFFSLTAWDALLV